MANAERGEVGFEAGGKTYTLRYTVNALCELEDHLGKTTAVIVDEMQAGASMKMVRAVVWAGLVGGGQTMTVKEAGDLISDIGFQAAVEVIGQAFSRAFPEAKEDDAPPPKGGSKAGANS